MEKKTAFEALLGKHRVVVERYINFRIPSRFDADDVIQETYYAAYLGFSKLQSAELFKPWLLSIARNQCNLWYRKHYRAEVLPLEEVCALATPDEAEQSDEIVQDILMQLPASSAELLSLTMQGYRQSEIAAHLGIPLGTVKSRLHYAKKQFRCACTPEQLLILEKGRKAMSKNDYTCGFPAEMSELTITTSPRPFTEIKCADEAFIIPKVGNKNSEGTYRYPDKKLALVSTCTVPKAATVHEVPGVKICRDTYNIKAGKLYKNEAIWFAQLTDEYIRDLATVACDADDEFPTAIYTFLEEDYDVIVNGNDRVHGRPLLIREHPPKIENGKIYVDEYNQRYTMGCFDVTIGARRFETVCYICPQMGSIVTENYVDTNGRLVLMRYYELLACLDESMLQKTAANPTITVNDNIYRLSEDRSSQYAL